jgi:hypothetical protein
MLDARARRPHWLITKYDHTKMNALTVWLGGDSEALAIFGFEEEAEMFLHLRRAALEEGWGVRQTSVGELVSVLYGPCSNAKKVVLDPLPGVPQGASSVVPVVWACASGVSTSGMLPSSRALPSSSAASTMISCRGTRMAGLLLIVIMLHPFVARAVQRV